MGSKRGRLLSVDEAAAYLGLSKASIYRLVERADIACVRTDGRVMQRRLADGTTERYVKSGRVRFLEKDLEDWLEAHRVPARTEPERPRQNVGPEPPTALHDLIPKVRRFS